MTKKIDINNPDLMSLDAYSLQDMLITLMTKDAAHTLNAFGMVENLDSLGHYVKTGENTCRIIMGNEFDHLIFRGQNKPNEQYNLENGKNSKKFMPSFQRINAPLNHCIEWVKKEDFKDFFTTTPFFKRLPDEIGILGKKFDFDLEALAQHYEFKTDYLDITKSFNVAMFFAYSQYHNGIYYPIQDFEKDNLNPCIYVSSISHLQNLYREQFKVVGFQVSPRPLNQQAMGLDLNGLNNVENTFTKIDLPKNTYMSVGVFNSFRKGFVLFQPDFINDVATKIKSDKIIRNDLLDAYCKLFSKDRISLEKGLLSEKYIISNEKLEITQQQEDSLNYYIDTIIKPFISKNIGHRRVFYQKELINEINNTRRGFGK